MVDVKCATCMWFEDHARKGADGTPWHMMTMDGWCRRMPQSHHKRTEEFCGEWACDVETMNARKHRFAPEELPDADWPGMPKSEPEPERVIDEDHPAARGLVKFWGGKPEPADEDDLSPYERVVRRAEVQRELDRLRQEKEDRDRKARDHDAYARGAYMVLGLVMLAVAVVAVSLWIWGH